MRLVYTAEQAYSVTSKEVQKANTFLYNNYLTGLDKKVVKNLGYKNIGKDNIIISNFILADYIKNNYDTSTEKYISMYETDVNENVTFKTSDKDLEQIQLLSSRHYLITEILRLTKLGHKSTLEVKFTASLEELEAYTHDLVCCELDALDMEIAIQKREEIKTQIKALIKEGYTLEYEIELKGFTKELERILNRLLFKKNNNIKDFIDVQSKQVAELVLIAS